MSDPVHRVRSMAVQLGLAAITSDSHIRRRHFIGEVNIGMSAEDRARSTHNIKSRQLGRTHTSPSTTANVSTFRCLIHLILYSDFNLFFCSYISLTDSI